MVLGSKTKGVAMHQHFMSWLGLLAGSKRWFVFPPEKDMEGFSHRHHSRRALRQAPGVKTCLQRAGDIVVLPGGWWHATFDEDEWTFGLGAQQYDPEDDETTFAASIGNLSHLKKARATNALLKIAAEHGHNEAVHLLVKRKASPKEALHTACHKGHLTVVETLLQLRANVNHVDHAGDPPLSPIHAAVTAGKSPVVQFLLQRRANLNPKHQTNQEPLLHSASRFGHIKVLRALLGARAELRARLPGAGEAIHDAAHFGHAGAVQELVAWRADPFAVTAQGATTPLQLAEEAGHGLVAELLKGMVRPEL